MIATSLFCVSTFLVAQNNRDSIDLKNELNIEIFGSAVLYSINYERTIYKYGRWDVRLKGGTMILPVRITEISEYRVLAFQLEPKLLYHFGNNSFDLGFGYTWIYLFDSILNDMPFTNDPNTSLHLLVPRLGYRWYFRSRKHYVGLGVTPFILLNKWEFNDNKFFPFGGISYGFKF